MIVSQFTSHSQTPDVWSFHLTCGTFLLRTWVLKQGSNKETHHVLDDNGVYLLMETMATMLIICKLNIL